MPLAGVNIMPNDGRVFLPRADDDRADDQLRD
jgi:hypothetical protein